MTTDPPKINLTLDPAKQTLDLTNVRITASANPTSIGLGNDGMQIIKDYIVTPPYEGDYEVTPTKQTQILATDGLKMTDDVTVNPIPDEYIIPSGSQTITANDTYDISDKAEVVVAVPDPAMQSKSVSFTPSESVQTDTVVPSAGYDGLDEVDISVDAIPSTYVGSAIDRRDSDDLTASGATVSVPGGFYESNASKAIANASMNNPAASKGAVSNHSVNVTPSVEVVSAGYITAGTRTGTPVTVSASDLVSGTKTITENGIGIDVAEYADVTVNVSGGSPVLQTKTKSYTPTESAQTESVTADVGYDGLEEVDITVGAISSTYVGSGITRRDSSDLTKSGATISVPAGYYENNASKSVTSGTAGTPSASKGAVSNHSIAVTPSVTNTSGYITGSTITGTAVTVSASELVSGTKSISANGTGIDVTNYAAVDVAVPGATLQTKTKTYTPTESQQTDTITPDVGYDGLDEVDVTVNAISSTYVGSGITRRSSSDLTVSGATVSVPSGYYENSASKSVASGTAGTPTATKGAVSNHSVSVTPSVTNTTGYITGSTKTGTAVTVSASELVSGSQTITSNSTVDVTNLAEVVVAVSGSSSPISGFVWHTCTGTTYRTVGGSNSALKRESVDDYRFSLSNGVFSCLRAGSYKILYFGRGGYSSVGSAISLRFRLYAAGSQVASSTGVTNTGVASSVTVTLSVGDTVYAETSNSSGNNTHDFGFVITDAE